MSLWRRQRRSAGQVMGSAAPWVSVRSAGFADIDGGQIDTAMQSIAVRTAADLIASLGSELPVDVYRGTGRDLRAIPMPGYLEDPGGDGYGLPDWAYRVLISWLLRGNLFGEELARARAGHVTQVEVFHPDAVSGWLDDGTVVWQVNGRHVEKGMLHRRVNPVPGRVLGMSPIAYHASTIGVSLASTQFGLQWFGDGGHPTGILRNTEVPLDPDGNAKTAKQRFMAALRGRREPLVLGKGWEYQQIQVNPEESQFLETMGYSEAQCARMFGPGIAEVLGYSVKGASLTYSNLADRDLHLLKYALGKWLSRLERLLTEFLPRGQHVVLNRDALLATTTLQRYQAHASALGAKWKVPNEVRELEDLRPVPWGDEPVGVDPQPEPEPNPPADNKAGDE